jgi:hypothetical protein
MSMSMSKAQQVKASNRLASKGFGPGSQMCAFTVGEARVDGMAAMTIGQDRPEDLQRAFEKARYWRKFNPFVGLIFPSSFTGGGA